MVRLCSNSFSFPRQALFAPFHRAPIHRALGAVNRQGRPGKQLTVMKRVTLLFRLATQTHLFYPSFDLESKMFWTTVLSDVREEEPMSAQELNAQSLAEVVSVYTQAYANRRDERDDDEADGFYSAFELLTPNKRRVNPKNTLLSLVRVWAKLFRAHKIQKKPKHITHKSEDVDTNDNALQTCCPDQLPNETDADYISRLKATLKHTIATEKAAQDEINYLKRSQKSADALNRDRNDRLHATLDRMDVKLKQTERELRLERMGAGGEDDPWVPFRDYAYQLDGPC